MIYNTDFDMSKPNKKHYILIAAVILKNKGFCELPRDVCYPQR